MDEAARPRANVRDIALAAIEALDGVESATDAGGTVYSAAGGPFARLTADALDLRLEPLVAQAALRTPDTTASDRGPGWVRFAPRALDRFAADRVRAWIEHAWRHAAD